MRLSGLMSGICVAVCVLAAPLLAADDIPGPVPLPPPAAPDAAAVAPPPPEVTPQAPDALAVLRGLNEEDVLARLGNPTLARGEGLGAMWTYVGTRCSLFVFFSAPAPGTPRLFSGATVGPRQRGERPLPLEECLAQWLPPSAPPEHPTGGFRPS